MIGAALIVIALLLTCGPLSGLFAPDAAKVETPSVAAGPPEGEGESLDAAAAGAAAGAGAGNMGATVAGIGQNVNGSLEAGLDIPVHESAGANVATGGTGSASMPSAGSTAGTAGATTVAGAGAGAGTAAATAVASSGSGSGAAATTPVAAATSAAAPPPVSAAPPAVPVAAGAANAFDQAYAGVSGDGFDAAGKVVDRFAPPVAAVGSGALALNGAQRRIGSSGAGVRAPCDSPGAGCRNVPGGAAPPTPPTPPTPPMNPPLRPGQPPPPPNFVP
jgi:hypothetical protein